MPNKKISEFNDNTNPSGENIFAIVVSGVTMKQSLSGLTGFFSDTYLTGGTYSTGTTVFTNNTGGTFSVSGFSTGGGETFTGGTVTGSTIFNNGLTTNTISATTYQNLPTDVRVTGGTYSSGTTVFTNNIGGTFNVTGYTNGTTQINYWSAGTGLNSVIQNDSNSIADGIGSLVGGSGNSANSQYSVALGLNSIADGFEILPVLTGTNISSGGTSTISDPFQIGYSFILSGNVVTEWDGIVSNPLQSNEIYVSDISGNTAYLNLYDGNTVSVNYNTANTSTYLTPTEILQIESVPFTSYTMISATSYVNVSTTFDRPAFVLGSNSVVTGSNSIVLGADITGNTNNTTYVDYLSIKRFLNNNIIFGEQAGSGATNANNSNFLGQYAGFNASGASYTNLMGREAGYLATDAYSSNFFSYQAGYQATFAFGSNFIGNQAGFGATNASNSNFFGNNAGNGATGAGASNFIGQFAGFQAAGASYSNFMGYQAGFQATNAKNSNFIGYQAGYQATGASYSNLFGYKVGDAQSLGSLGSNNIIIGTNISLPSGTINSINLGGVLFGTGTYSATAGTSSISGQTQGKIGINIVNPVQSFEVSGGTRLYGGLTAETYSNLPPNYNVTGGTYSSGTGIMTFYNSTGNSFDVVGVTLGPAPDSRLITKSLLVNQSNSTTTLTAITGLTESLTTGIYQFRYMVRYQSSATTNGVRFSVNHTGSITWFVANIHWVDVSAASSTGAGDQDSVLTTGAVYGSFAARTKSTTGWGTTLSVDTANSDMLMVIEGTFQASTSGNIELWHGSEVAVASTVMAGSNLVLTKI